MSFVTNSNSVGVGARFQLRKKVALNIAYFKTIYKHYKRQHDDFYNIKGTFGGMLNPLAQQLTAGAQQIGQALQQPNLSEAQRLAYQTRLAEIRTELGAAQKIQTGLGGYISSGSENSIVQTMCLV